MKKIGLTYFFKLLEIIMIYIYICNFLSQLIFFLIYFNRDT